MKDSKTIKKYSNRLLGIVNKVRLLGINFSDSRIVEKILVTVPERYEASLTTLENTKDLSKITLAELLNALQAQEQHRLMRQDHIVEGALPAKHQEYGKYKKKYFKKYQIKARVEIKKEAIHLVSIVAEQVIHHSNAGRGQKQSVTSVISLDTKLLSRKTNFRYEKQMLKLLIKMMKIRCLWLPVFQLGAPQKVG